MTTFLTPKQVREFNTTFGYLEFGDAQGDVSRAFAQAAIEKHERLCAAAPEMLRVLTELLNAEDPITHAMWVWVRAVVNKANG